MSTAKTPALKQTEEYRLFKHDPANRNVRKLKKIIASMRQHGFLPAHPLACVPNGTGMYVRDGQHRLEAAKALGIPVYYVCSEQYQGVSIPEINGATAGAWSPRDYIESYCNQGKVEYAKLRSFIDETGFPAAISASLLSGEQAASTNQGEDLKSGRFIVKDFQYAQQVAAVSAEAKRHAPAFYRNRSFLDAISKAVRVPGVTSDLLCEKIQKYPYILRHEATSDGFLEVLEDLVNRHSQRGKMNVKFLANQAARARSVAAPRKS